jgi:RNA polymerase sigma-70 factor, ECF subfamily
VATIAQLSIFDENRELLEGFRRGERGALVAVYEHYVDDVALLVRRGFSMQAQDGRLHVPGAPDIDAEHELIQETFVKAFSYRAREAYDGVRPYRPFLLRIAKNSMIDRFRVHRRETSYDGGAGDIDALLADNAPLAAGGDADGWPGAPASDLDTKRLVEATREFVASLPPQARALVRARFEDELSQDAAAEALGCSRRRVRTLEARVQRELRRYLRRRGFR